MAVYQEMGDATRRWLLDGARNTFTSCLGEALDAIRMKQPEIVDRFELLIHAQKIGLLVTINTNDIPSIGLRNIRLRGGKQDNKTALVVTANMTSMSRPLHDLLVDEAASVVLRVHDLARGASDAEFADGQAMLDYLAVFAQDQSIPTGFTSISFDPYAIRSAGI